MAVMTLQVAQYLVAKMQQPEFFLRPALKGVELVLQVSGDTIAVDDRKLWVAIHSLKVAIQKPGSAAVMIGSARPGAPMRFTQDGKQRQLQHEFVLILTASEFQAIDDIRDSGDVTLQVTFTGEGGDKAVIDSYFPTHDMHSFTIPKSVWLERLRQAKVQDVLLFEVPMPFMDDAKAAPAVKHFAEAQRMLAEGHYTKAVLDCRKALEALGKREGRLKNWAPTALDRLASHGRAQLTKEERELAAQASLHHFANLSAHDGDYDREDAKLALLLCAAYLAKAFAN